MAYEVRVAPAAGRQIRKLGAVAQGAALEKLEELAEDPRPNGSEKIKGLPRRYKVYRLAFSCAESWYRVVWQVKDDETLVLVVKLGDRKEVYERMSDLKRLLL